MYFIVCRGSFIAYMPDKCDKGLYTGSYLYPWLYSCWLVALAFHASHIALNLLKPNEGETGNMHLSFYVVDREFICGFYFEND